MRTLVLLPALFAAVLAGCSITGGMDQQVQQFNANQAAQYLPTRMKLTVFPNGASSLNTGAWAGTPGESAAKPEFRQRILEGFKSQCGFEESALKEIRVVKHEPPTWYEVWIFHNPNAKDTDKLSGLSVVMQFDPTTNQSNIRFYGNCL